MSRPTDDPQWATGSTYGAGPYAGNANKNRPPSGNITEGFDPQSGLPASWLNYWLNNHGQWINYLDSRSVLREEWIGAVASLTGTQSTPIVGAERWIYRTSTTTQFSLSPASTTYPHPVAKLATSASLSSEGALYTGQKIFNPSTSSLLAVLKTTVAVDLAGDSYIGFCDQNDFTSGASRFIRFRQSHGTANWQAECSVSGTTTTVDTGVAATSSTDPNTSFSIEIHGSSISGGAKVIFSINGTIVATITTNIPALPCYVVIQPKNTNSVATTTTVGPVLVVW